jgi:hypothetical protein
MAAATNTTSRGERRRARNGFRPTPPVWPAGRAGLWAVSVEVRCRAVEMLEPGWLRQHGRPGPARGDLVVGRVTTRASARRRRGDHHPEPAGKMNAFNATMWDELLDVCREIGASEIDRCVVISGGWGLLLQYRSRCHRRGRAAPSVGRNATREPRRRRIAPVAAADDLQGHRCGGRRRGESGLWLRPRGGVGGRPKFRGR